VSNKRSPARHIEVCKQHSGIFVSIDAQHCGIYVLCLKNSIAIAGQEIHESGSGNRILFRNNHDRERLF